MSLEEQSFKNMVDFYQDELRQILQGTKPSDVFSDHRRRTLTKWGVIETPKGRPRGGDPLVTEAAQTLL